MIKIESIMIKDVLTAKKEDNIYSIIEKMYYNFIGGIVIVNSENFPIGIVTERDIIHGLHSYKEKLLNHTAQDIMSSPVLTLEPDDDVESALILMLLNRIRRIPIVKNNKLVGIISYQDITNSLRKSLYKLEEESEKLIDKANRDTLTGLYNKGFILSQLDYHMSLSKQSGNPFAVIMIDIDHFKKINDTYGHVCGDKVLKELAKIFVEKSREINIIGRYGGEEFLIVAPLGDHKTAYYLAERLRCLVEKNVFICDSNKIKLTISAGISIWHPNIKNSEELIKMADKALYIAKRSGRNQVRLFE